MKYVSATRAAEIIGVTPRTITTWLKEGKLSAHHPGGAKTRLAIPLSEVEAIARERSQYREEEKETIDITSLLERMEGLENKVASLENEIRVIASRPSYDDSAYDGTSEKLPRQKRITGPNKAPLPDGAILARYFAQQYGVAPETFRDHYVKGLGPERDKVQISSRPKPGREKTNQTEWYVMPGEVQGVLDFWTRHNVSFKTPETQLTMM